MVNVSYCEICKTKLDPDGSCPLCEIQAEADRFFRKYEKEVLGWKDQEEYEFDAFGWGNSLQANYGIDEHVYNPADFAEDQDYLDWVLSGEDIGEECHCPVCRGVPHEDPIFKTRFES